MRVLIGESIASRLRPRCFRLCKTSLLPLTVVRDESIKEYRESDLSLYETWTQLECIRLIPSGFKYGYKVQDRLVLKNQSI